VYDHAPQGSQPADHARPLRIAALVKQVPPVESLSLGSDGRLERDGDDLEMNAYCRRAVSKATELARATGGTCTVFTLGPPAAEDVLREAVAWGADVGVHLCDPAFAGSDTLATARSLAAAIRMEGPFDLVLVGRNSIDGDTGQVGPEVAELAGLPFCGGARRLEVSGSCLRLQLEHDDGWEETEVEMRTLGGSRQCHQGGSRSPHGSHQGGEGAVGRSHGAGKRSGVAAAGPGGAYVIHSIREPGSRCRCSGCQLRRSGAPYRWPGGTDGPLAVRGVAQIESSNALKERTGRRGLTGRGGGGRGGTFPDGS
jgi:hypothetical protein